MGSSATGDIARAYFEAWSGRQGKATVGAFLAEDYVFMAGPMRMEGRDAFLAAGQWPDDATTVLLADAYDDNTGFQLYEATNGANRVRIAEHMTFRDGLIATSEVITDSAAFAAFMTG